MSSLHLIRPVRITDAPALTEIYNYAVENTTATFDTEIKSVQNRESWIQSHDEVFAVLVAELDNAVVGYASLNRWSDRKAYDIIAELSIYIHPQHQGKGLGNQLFYAILDHAKSNGALVSILSRITSDNEQSLAMHRKAGFETVGVLKSCGIKFNRYHDVVMMQKMLKK